VTLTLLLLALAVETDRLSAESSAPLPPPEFVKQWGGRGDGEGQLFMPWGIAIGSDHLLYVSDYGNNRIQVFSPEGEFLQGWGQLGSGLGRLRGPVGIALGPEGNLYVADAFNYRVQVFTPEGEPLRTWSGPPSENQPFTPWGIAVAPNGSVYVSDLHANRVYQFTSEGGLLRSWGGLGTGDGEFTGPTGIVVSPVGEVYVVDSLGYRVEVFTSEGEFLRGWGDWCDLYIHPGRGCRDPDGPGPLESGDGQLSSPWGITLDADGRVYVADSANKRIQVFTLEGEFLLKWGVLGRGPGEFDNPVGVAVDGRGGVYVADLNNNRIQKFSFVQSASVRAGPGDAPPSGGPPMILDVQLPDQIELNGLPVPGRVSFFDPEGDVREARFRVVDGKYDPFTIPLDRDDGEFSFRVTCEIAQQVTLKLTLVDRSGQRSAPRGVSFTCGEPPQGDYDEEQATTRPTRYTLGLNIFLLDDGVTTLSEGAGFSDVESAIARPSDEVRRAIERQIVPAVTNIWDQCGVAYELQNLVVVRPGAVQLAQGNLDELLFVRERALAEIALSDPNRLRPISVLTEALGPIAQALESQGGALDPRSLSLFVTGARIVLKPGDARHFGGVTTIGGRVSLVRWDTIWVVDEATGEIFLPKRPITAIAHELGHDFGLEHVGLIDDPSNLMLSVPGRPTAVPPEPTVHLLPGQCESIESTVRPLDLLGGSN
jgi:DNA-binding beta-propeller fold protein YncE